MGPDIIKLGDELYLVKDYKECHLINDELKAILNYDKAKLEKKVKKHWSSKVATKMVLVDQNKFPIQLAKLQANAYFKNQLAKCDTTRFTCKAWGNCFGYGKETITFGMLNEVEKAMKATTKEALEDCIEDSKVNDDLKDMPDHVKRMNEANKTFAVTPLHSKEDTEPENLSDFDSMAIKIAFD